MRETHELKRRFGDRYPTQVATVWCDLVEYTSAEHPPARRYDAEKIGLSTWVRQKGRPTRWHHLEVDACTLHGEIFRMCRAGTSTWLFCWDLYRCLTALNFWEKIGADKEWALEAGGTERDNGDATESRGWRGFAVLEDSCTILVIRRRHGGVLHLVDLRNFGIKDFDGVLYDYRDPELGAKHPYFSPPPVAAPDAVQRAAATMFWYLRWEKFLSQQTCGTLQHTISSQAFYAFRRQFLNECVVVHNHEETLELERAALYGGRCEAYFVGRITTDLTDPVTEGYYGAQVPTLPARGPIYHLDAHSLYGACGAVYQVPTTIAAIGAGEPKKSGAGEPWLIADVTVETEHAVIPYRDPATGLLLFPTGIFRTTLCQPELGWGTIKILEYHRWAAYYTRPLFREWAVWCWQMRRKYAGSDCALYDQMKLWSQVLYGKFGQRQRGWLHASEARWTEPWSLWYEHDPETDTIVPYRTIAGRPERHVDLGETHDSCPAIAAAIAAYARVALATWILAAGWDHVYYVDTDSIMVDGEGLKNLRGHGLSAYPLLGALRLIGEYRDLEIVGHRHYIADGIVTCAGIAPPRDYRSHGRPRSDGAEPATAAAAQFRPPINLTVPAGAGRHGGYRHGNVRPSGIVVPFRIGG